MAAVLTELVELLVGAIAGVAAGIGQGLSTLMQSIFLSGAGTQADPYTLSVFGGVTIIFCAVGLAIGLSRWAVMFVTSLGARN